MAVYTISILVSIRSVVAEVYLQRILGINILSDIVLELSIVWLFIISNVILDGVSGFIAYMFLMLVYSLVKRNDISKAFFIAKHRLFADHERV